ncbi:MAG: hypothetical protein GWP10_06545 [Nitrospiraceae bacterium]|nr:hypothetical protein [Nitrospiraceae bacterium]
MAKMAFICQKLHVVLLILICRGKKIGLGDKKMDFEEIGDSGKNTGKKTERDP